MIKLKEKELVRIYHKGKNEPVCIWLDKYKGDMYAMARSKLKNFPESKELAYDCIADVIKKMIECTIPKRKEFPKESSVKACLAHRAASRAIDIYRKLKRIVDKDDDTLNRLIDLKQLEKTGNQLVTINKELYSRIKADLGIPKHKNKYPKDLLVLNALVEKTMDIQTVRMQLNIEIEEWKKIEARIKRRAKVLKNNL